MPSPERNHRHPTSALVLGGVALAVLAANAAHYHPFQVDDTFIALQYSRRLLDGHGLTWTDGLHPAAGYTSLLWVLACAALGALGLDLETASRALGLLGAAMAVLAPLLAWPPGRVGWIPAAWASLLIATSGCVAAWAIGGLEETLLAGVLAMGLAALLRGRTGLAGLIFTPLPLVRPDAVLLVAAVGAAVVLKGGLRRGAWLDLLRLVAGPVAAILFDAGLLQVLYGEPYANTAHAKLLSDPRIPVRGEYYVLGGILPGLLLAILPPVLWLAASIGALSRLRRTPIPAWFARGLVLALPLAVWTSYVIVVGGDFMPAHRHLVPFVVLAAMLGAEGLSAVAPNRWAGLALLLLPLHAWLQVADVSNQMAWAQRDGSKRAAAGRLMGEIFGPAQPRVAIEAAGALPYFSELPAIDMLGLNDWHIAHQPPLAPGAAPGHGLGDPAWVLEQAPDIVLFCGLPPSPTPCWPAGRGLVELPGWSDYQQVGIETSLGLIPIWVHRSSERVGRRWLDPDTLVLPAWLFDYARVRWDARALVLVGGDAPATDTVSLPAGNWSIEGATWEGKSEISLLTPGEVVLQIAPWTERSTPVRVLRKGASGATPPG